MDLCWLFAWGNFITVTTNTTRFPMWAGLSSFLVALGISSFFIKRNHRRIWPVLAHGCSAVVIGWTVLNHISDKILPQTNHQWFSQFITAMLITLFWYKGARLAYRSGAYKSVCNHFDLGISLLFYLVFIKFILELKINMEFREPFAFYCIGAYFLFGLIALFLSYNELGGKKTFVKGFRTYGILTSVIATLLITSIGSFLLFQPIMTDLAQASYAAVQTAAGSIGHYIISFLRFLINARGFLAKHQEGVHGKENSGLTYVFNDDNAGMGQNFIVICILFLLFIAFLWLTGYLCYRFYLFLMSKPSEAAHSTENTRVLSILASWIRFLFQFFQGMMRSFSRNIRDAGKGFECLTKWGKKSGVAKALDETPSEYALRLQQRFRPLENEIRTIIFAFQLEAYGEISLDPDEISQVAGAVRTIHSPAFWLLRLKSIWKK